MSAADEKAVLVQRLASAIRAYRRRRLNAKPTPSQTNWWKVSAFVVAGIVVLFIIAGILGEPAASPSEEDGKGTQRAEPTSTVHTISQCPTPEEKAYFDALGQIGLDTAEALGFLGNSLGRVSDIPYADWQVEMVLALSLVLAQADAIWALPEPPDSVSDIDRDMGVSAAILDQIVTKMARGIDDFDLDAIESATADVEGRLSPQLIATTEKIATFCQ